MSALLEFECQVPVKGYEVITVEVERPEDEDDESSPMYIEKWRVLQPRSERTRPVDLFKAKFAYLEFAQTPATEDGIKDFADRYGPLFPDIGTGPDQYGRSIFTWSSYIEMMRRIVELWKKSRVTGDFRKIIRATKRIRAADDLISFMELGGPANLLTGVEVQLLLKEDPQSASPRLCIRPNSLAHALWAQFLLKIDGNVNLGACVQCRKLFTLEAGRSDKEYCSDACRMRAYRKRKGSG